MGNPSSSVRKITIPASSSSPKAGKTLPSPSSPPAPPKYVPRIFCHMHTYQQRSCQFFFALARLPGEKTWKIFLESQGKLPVGSIKYFFANFMQAFMIKNVLFAKYFRRFPNLFFFSSPTQFSPLFPRSTIPHKLRLKEDPPLSSFPCHLAAFSFSFPFRFQGKRNVVG